MTFGLNSRFALTALLALLALTGCGGNVGGEQNGNATAADIEALGEEVRRRVLEKFGVTLEWEIKRIGVTGEHV